MEGDTVDENGGLDKLYFYPRPHMEGDRKIQRLGGPGRISTHALTWRATANMLKCRRAFQQLI